MAATFLTDLAHVVTVDDDDTIHTDASILIEDGVITAIGPASDLRERADRVRATHRPSSGHLAMPGLVNLHTHTPMTLLRGLAENVDLQGFLARVWAAEGAIMDPDTVTLGAQLGALEALLGGTTTALDMYFHHEAAHDGARALGLRHVGGPVFFDGPGPDGLAWPQRLDQLARWQHRLADDEAAGAPHVPTVAMPHATYTNSPAHLRELADAISTTWTRPVLHTHVSENAGENANVHARYAASPTEILHAAGLLRPDLPAVLGHGVHLSAADRGLVAAAGAAVAHCPGSNQKLASGELHWQDWRGSGIRLGIGTDGCSSSNDLDMWQAMRQAALQARLTSGDPAAAPATEVIRAATIDGARALGLGELIGSLEIGKRADLILIDLDAPHLTPVHDVPALLVFAAGRADVSDVWVDGHNVIAQRRSTLMDQSRLLHACRERAAHARTAVADIGDDA